MVKEIVKVKAVVRQVYYDKNKNPYYTLNNKKHFVKNTNAIYGPSYKPLIQVLTTNMKAKYI